MEIHHLAEHKGLEHLRSVRGVGVEAERLVAGRLIGEIVKVLQIRVCQALLDGVTTDRIEREHVLQKIPSKRVGSGIDLAEEALGRRRHLVQELTGLHIVDSGNLLLAW